MLIPFPAATAPAEAPALHGQGTHGEERLAYGALRARVAAAQARLAEAGVRPGDRVALWGPNGFEWVIGALALWRLGAATVLVSPRWTDRELRAALARLEVRGVLAPSELAVRAQGSGFVAWDWGSQIPSELSELGSPQPSAASAATEAAVALTPGGLDFEAPLALQPNAPAVYVFTSGTTGVPKAVELRWGALYASAEAVCAVLELGPEDAWWQAMPLCHVGGLGAMLRCFWRGAEVRLAQRFEPAAAVAALCSGAVTIASFVPTMLRAVLDTLGERPWPARVRAAMLGGAAIPEDLVARCPAALASYGLSEAASTVTLVPPGASAALRSTSGLPLPGTSLVLRDAAGDPVPAGEVGEITLQSPSRMAGYFADAAASARAVRDGVLYSGDYGRLDAQGALTVLSRREDLIISGGENLYPAEIEAALRTHPLIAEAVVVAVADARWGQRPFAFLQAEPAAPSEADLASWLSERLARFKHPAGYAWLREWPLLANGKIDRRALRALAPAFSSAAAGMK